MTELLGLLQKTVHNMQMELHQLFISVFRLKGQETTLPEIRSKVRP